MTNCVNQDFNIDKKDLDHNRAAIYTPANFLNQLS